MKTALIIGVSGQDGAYLARHLLGQGLAVHGSSRKPGVPLNLERLGIGGRVVVHRLDPCDGPAVGRLLADIGPDQIYLLSGQSSIARSFEAPAETFRSIADSTLAVLEAMRETARQSRLFVAGSASCFGDVGSGGADIGTPFQPDGPYSAAKAAAFWLVDSYRRSFGMPVCTGILFNHESPLRAPTYVTRKVTSAVVAIAAGETMRLRLGNLAVWRDWGWAPEYVVAMHAMLERDETEDFVIATGETRSLEEFVASAFARVGLDWRDHVDIVADLARPFDPRRSAASIIRTGERLGWQAETRMEGVVRRLIDCARSQGWG